MPRLSRVLGKSGGSSQNFGFQHLTSQIYRSVVPTLAKNARMGHPADPLMHGLQSSVIMFAYRRVISQNAVSNITAQPTAKGKE